MIGAAERNMADGVPWLDARKYYQARWCQPVGRVGVDAGFSCPNRGTDRATGACAFCAEAGNRPPYVAGAEDLDGQIDRGLAFQANRYGFQKFSLYFQSFSSTWAPVERLRSVYNQGLSRGDFVELVVGTRPDCIPETVADLLVSYRSADRDVWVELGLQSSRDDTLARIDRGHTAADFARAAERLASRKLPVTAHLMFGLPGESADDFRASVRFALDAGVRGLKFHDLILVPGTRLHEEWRAGRLSPVDPEAYLDAVASVVADLPPDIVVWRVCSDPEDRTAEPAPGKKWPKNRFLNRLSAEVRKRRGL